MKIKRFDTLTLLEMKKLYRRANKAYHTDGTSELTDAQFDRLEGMIAELEPEWVGLKRTGAKVGKKVAVDLPYPMPSLGKIFADNVDTLNRWVDSQGDAPLWATPKLDGNSVLLVYDKGQPKQLITRGNGIEGKDISYFIPALGIKPLKRKLTRIVRCEIMLPISVHQKKWSKDFDNPRNGIAGILNRQDVHPALKDAHIFVLRVMNRKGKPSAELSKMSGLLMKGNVTVVPSIYLGVREARPEYLAALLKDMKRKMDFELDGIVLQSDLANLPHTTDKPKYARAWKLNDLDNAVIAKVKRILWNESSHGIIVPKVELVPVKVGGVTVKYATANNAKWAKDRSLGPGAQIKLVRSGDVIPKIIEVVKKGKFTPPDKILIGNYRWDEHGTHLVLSKPGDSDTVKAKKLQRFFSKLDIEFVSISAAEKMVSVGYDTVEKVLKMRQRDFLKLPGFGERAAERAVTSLEAKLSVPIPLPKLMVASGIFARGIGERRIDSIISYSQAWVYKSNEMTSQELLREVRNVPRMPIAMAEDYAKNVHKFWKFLERTGLQYEPYKAHRRKDGPLKGQCFSWTGYRSKEEEAWIESLGGEVVPFGSKTTTLIYKIGGKASSKVDKAREKGIKAVEINRIRKQFGLPAR